MERFIAALFECAMLILGISAAILGYRKTGPTDSNVFGGLMSVYFVVTALTTVPPDSRWMRPINVAAVTARRRPRDGQYHDRREDME